MQPNLPLLDIRSECCINSSTYLQVSLLPLLALCSSIGRSTKVRLTLLAQHRTQHLEAEKNPHLHTVNRIVLQTVDCKSSSFSSSDRSTSFATWPSRSMELFLSWLNSSHKSCQPNIVISQVGEAIVYSALRTLRHPHPFSSLATKSLFILLLGDILAPSCLHTFIHCMLW